MKKIILSLLFALTCAQLLAVGPVNFSFFKSSTTPDVTPPTVSSIAVNGTAWTVVFSEPVQSGGAGFSSGWATSGWTGGNPTLTYSSGTGTSTLLYTGSVSIPNAATGTATYTQPGTGIKDIAGNNLATTSAISVTNNTPGSGPTFVSAASTITSSGGSGTATCSITIGSTVTNACVLVITGGETNTDNLGAATFGGNSTTQIFAGGGGSRDVYVSYYKTASLTAGTYNAVLTDTTFSNPTIVILVFSGVNQTTPTGTVASDGPGYVFGTSATAASVSGDLVVAAAWSQVQVLTPGAGQTDRVNAHGSGNGGEIEVSTKAATTTTTNMTASTSPDNTQLLAVFALKQ